MKRLLLDMMMLFYFFQGYSQRVYINYLEPQNQVFLSRADSFYFSQNYNNAISLYQNLMRSYQESIYLNQAQNYLSADSVDACMFLLSKMVDSFYFFKADIIDQEPFWDKIKQLSSYQDWLSKANRNFEMYAQAEQIALPKVTRELLWMGYQDQKYIQIEMFRNRYKNAYKTISSKQLAIWKTSVLEGNKRKLDSLIIIHGYLGMKEVGSVGAQLVWLITQHADFDLSFQQKILASMTVALKHGDCDSSEYAMLTDRVLVGEGKKQKFGTQLHYVTQHQKGKNVKKQVMWPVEDPKHLDVLRKTYGLPPIKEYLEMMRQ